MRGHYALPLIAVFMVIFAGAHAWYVQKPEPQGLPPVPPPTSPFGHTVAGAGMVEPSTEASGTGNIAVGSQLAGVVTRVWIRIGQEVKAGYPLFDLDRRQTDAELKVRQAALVAAQAQLKKLDLQPRPEEVPPLEAQVRVVQATLAQQKDLLDRFSKLLRPKAISEQEVVSTELSVKAALAQVALARANLDLLKAGAWKPDKDIAAANVEQAKALVDQTHTTLDLLQVKAPVDGSILQINVRPGEYVASAPGQPLILMGNLHPLHVRVNVDEEDLPRLKWNVPARAKLRGDPGQEEIPLRFVRLEPSIVPKVSLTGVNTERVDTRVVQLIYAIDPSHHLVQENKVLVGQIVDVFVDTK